MTDYYLTLDPDFTVGHPELDRQHEQLIDLSNAFLDQLKYIQREEPKREVMIEMFTAVIDVMDEHFHYEESLLEQTSYPLLKEHKVEHQNVTNYLTIMLKKLQEGGMVDLKTVVTTMQNQSATHFRIFDSGYVPYLKELGKESPSPTKKKHV